MTTKLHKETVAAIEKWCAKKKWKLLKKPNHVTPQAYVVGYAASQCLIVAKCWANSEPQTMEWDKKYPLKVINEFDETLKAGDWCATAYICTQGWQQTIAIQLPTIKEKKKA